MKIIIHLLTAVALLAAIYLFYLAASTPGQYRLSDASAIQATQVYAIADHYALLAIGALLFGILLEITLIASASEERVSAS